MAAINICFSLSDSVITGKLMQDCGVGIDKYKGNEIGFIKAVGFWLMLSLGAAMVSRLTKNFQDYFTNIVIQRTGAEMYTDGIKKSLDLPYEDFEDQHSGETLSQLQKVRTDSEKLITLSISLIFQTVVGFIFVIIYIARIDYRIAFIFLFTAPIIAVVSSFLGKKIKIIFYAADPALAKFEVIIGFCTRTGETFDEYFEVFTLLHTYQKQVGELNKSVVTTAYFVLKKVVRQVFRSFGTRAWQALRKTGAVFVLLFQIS